MTRIIGEPPNSGLRQDGNYPGGWWHSSDDSGRIICDLCPRECHLKPGDRGFCFVRQNLDGEMVLTTYGRSTGFCIDPIEKKPLNHFLPGTSVLSFGTAGCNLGCKFCQNWDISKSREVERLSEEAGPEAIAQAARELGCRSVAYTYNDPVIWAEYAIETARACRAVGIKNVAVTAGYITPAARGAFYEFMDAANVDLKAFTEDFYYKITYSHLDPVLDTLRWLKHESNVWFEITNLIIPNANDSPDEIRQMCDWILKHVGDEVPVHFTAFHPDFRMRDVHATPHETLLEAYRIARQQGLRYVYVGNVNDVVHQSTYCPQCGSLLIERDWYQLGTYQLQGNHCGECNAPIAGVFESSPGTWGRKRLPVQMSKFARLLPIVPATSGDLTMSSAVPPASSPRIQAQRPKLDETQQLAIHRAACAIVDAEIQGRPEQLSDARLAGAADKTVMGAFVTLKREGKLRACCGSLGRPMPLLEALRQSAKRTALEDSRLPPISATELPFLEVDVTLLYGFQPLRGKGHDRIREVVVGQHGLQIRRGESAGLLLPGVAVEQGYDAETFLQQVCRKAGLASTAWHEEETQIQTFEGVSIPGAFAVDVGAPADFEERSHFTAAEIQQLAVACGENILALLRGATPSYYLPGCADGTVQGAALTLQLIGHPESLQFFRLSMRPGMPLQGTLFGLCEAATSAVNQQRWGAQELGQLRIGLTVLEGSAMHGTVAEPDVRGIHPARRSVLVLENGKSGLVFEPGLSPERLVAEAAVQAQSTNPAAASVFSFCTTSTETQLHLSSVPRPVMGSRIRPPAVAGKFYPSAATELNRLVEDFFDKSPKAPAESWPALMAPHAGLIYSGEIAARVFQQVQIPESVIVLCPKHTRLGVEWAVAPHEVWSLPGANVQADPALAKALVDAIPGLQFDAAAHHQEHAVEVELPFIHRLAPHTRVVGIAIGGGGLERCREFATGLAKVLRDWTPKPLLVISSDMNHYANDSETRELDEIAMRSLEQLDPAHVYETITKHGISMCGVLPAVIVLETLRQLGTLSKCQRVAYATSAEVSGDKDRCVGYAGMLFG